MWIESHQELGRHPKTKRLARTLDVSLPAAVGYLQFLWWWALDYANDGNLTRYSAEDIADAVLWDGDADSLWTAFADCGFIDVDNDNAFIHDWDDYAGKLLARREANTQRKRQARDIKTPDNMQSGDKKGRARDGRGTDQTVPAPSEATGHNLTGHNLTGHNLTVQDRTEDNLITGDDADEADTVQVPYAKIRDLYNGICVDLPSILKITGKRKQTVHARFMHYRDLDIFGKLFEKTQASDFLKGHGGKWNADFDWLMVDGNMTKVLEGKYDNRKKEDGGNGGDRDSPGGFTPSTGFQDYG